MSEQYGKENQVNNVRLELKKDIEVLGNSLGARIDVLNSSISDRMLEMSQSMKEMINELKNIGDKHSLIIAEHSLEINNIKNKHDKTPTDSCQNFIHHNLSTKLEKMEIDIEKDFSDKIDALINALIIRHRDFHDNEGTKKLNAWGVIVRIGGSIIAIAVAIAPYIVFGGK